MDSCGNKRKGIIAAIELGDLKEIVQHGSQVVTVFIDNTAESLFLVHGDIVVGDEFRETVDCV